MNNIQSLTKQNLDKLELAPVTEQITIISHAKEVLGTFHWRIMETINSLIQKFPIQVPVTQVAEPAPAYVPSVVLPSLSCKKCNIAFDSVDHLYAHYRISHRSSQRVGYRAKAVNDSTESEDSSSDYLDDASEQDDSSTPITHLESKSKVRLLDCDNKLYQFSRALLSKEQQEAERLANVVDGSNISLHLGDIVRPGESWLVILFRSGYFAGGIFKVAADRKITECDNGDSESVTASTVSALGDSTREKRKIKNSPRSSQMESYPTLILSKRFARYTTRRKQGGSQLLHDASTGFAAKSIGAQIRRENERVLHREIAELLSRPDWKSAIDAVNKIFLSCSNRLIPLLLHNTPILTSDTRIRRVPMSTGRPTIDELVRVATELTKISLLEPLHSVLTEQHKSSDLSQLDSTVVESTSAVASGHNAVVEEIKNRSSTLNSIDFSDFMSQTDNGNTAVLSHDGEGAVHTENDLYVEQGIQVTAAEAEIPEGEDGSQQPSGIVTVNNGIAIVPEGANRVIPGMEDMYDWYSSEGEDPTFEMEVPQHASSTKINPGHTIKSDSIKSETKKVRKKAKTKRITFPKIDSDASDLEYLSSVASEVQKAKKEIEISGEQIALVRNLIPEIKNEINALSHALTVPPYVLARMLGLEGLTLDLLSPAMRIDAFTKHSEEQSRNFRLKQLRSNNKSRHHNVETNDDGVISPYASDITLSDVAIAQEKLVILRHLCDKNIPNVSKSQSTNPLQRALTQALTKLMGTPEPMDPVIARYEICCQMGWDALGAAIVASSQSTPIDWVDMKPAN